MVLLDCKINSSYYHKAKRKNCSYRSLVDYYMHIQNKTIPGGVVSPDNHDNMAIRRYFRQMIQTLNLDGLRLSTLSFYGCAPQHLMYEWTGNKHVTLKHEYWRQQRSWDKTDRTLINHSAFVTAHQWRRISIIAKHSREPLSQWLILLEMIMNRDTDGNMGRAHDLTL